MATWLSHEPKAPTIRPSVLDFMTEGNGYLKATLFGDPPNPFGMGIFMIKERDWNELSRINTKVHPNFKGWYAS